MLPQIRGAAAQIDVTVRNSNMKEKRSLLQEFKFGKLSHYSVLIGSPLVSQTPIKLSNKETELQQSNLPRSSNIYNFNSVLSHIRHDTSVHKLQQFEVLD